MSVMWVYHKAVAMRQDFLRRNPGVHPLDPDAARAHQCSKACNIIDTGFTQKTAGADGHATFLRDKPVGVLEQAGKTEQYLVTESEESLFLCAESGAPHWCSPDCQDIVITMGDVCHVCSVSGRAYDHVLAAPSRFGGGENESTHRWTRDADDTSSSSKRKKKQKKDSEDDVPAEDAEEERMRLSEQARQDELKREGKIEAKYSEEARRIIHALLFSEERRTLNERNVEKMETKRDEAKRKYVSDRVRRGQPIMFLELVFVMEHFCEDLCKLNPQDNGTAEQHGPLVRELIASCIRLWRLINHYGATTVKQFKYKFEHHVRVVLWAAVTGIPFADARDEWILRPMPQLERMLPSRADLKDLDLGYKKSKKNKPQSRGTSVTNMILDEFCRVPADAEIGPKAARPRAVVVVEQAAPGKAVEEAQKEKEKEKKQPVIKTRKAVQVKLKLPKLHPRPATVKKDPQQRRPAPPEIEQTMILYKLGGKRKTPM